MIKFLILVVLCAAAVYDWKHHIIPNLAPLLIFGAGVANCFLSGMRLAPAAASGAVMLLLLLAVSLALDSFGSGGMGGGDIKLMAALAFALGIYSSMVVLLLANLLAVLCIAITYTKQRVTGKQPSLRRRIPMAPFFLISYIFAELV